MDETHLLFVIIDANALQIALYLQERAEFRFEQNAKTRNSGEVFARKGFANKSHIKCNFNR